MLIILITISILLIINFGNGILVCKILKINCNGFTLTSFIGIVSVTFLEAIIAFFYPLDFYVESGFIILGIIGFVQFLKINNNSYFDFRKNLNFWFFTFLVIILFVASFSPYLYDHFSYYAPTILYLKESGFIKGISNLDLLLGQTSFWHIFQAGFSNVIDSDLRINAYLLVLFLIYIYENKRWVLLLFIPFFLLFIPQPSPDLPVFVIALVIINELLNDRNRILILYLSIFAFCIKPIMFWLPLLWIFDSFYRRNFKFKMLILLLAFGMLFVVKNLWLFGFPVFPVSFIDFNLPWKPSQEILNYSSQIGLMKTYDMKYTYQQVIDFDFWEKMYHWFTIGLKSIFNFGIIICLMILGYFAYWKKEIFYKLLFICFLIKFILIVTFSAQYRFFIDIYLIAVFLVFKNISESKVIFTTVFISIFISVIFIFPGFVQKFNMGKQMSPFSWSQLYKPKENKSVNINSEYIIGNFNFNVPKYPFEKEFFPSLNIYDLKLYDYYGIFPQYLDKDLKNGFFQRKLTKEERIKLKEIISETQKYNPKIP